MLTRTHDLNIPTYSLEQSSKHSSKQFEIVTSGRGLTQRQKDLFFVPHRQNYYKLAFVKLGSSRHWVDMVPYTIRPNAFYFSSPQQVMLKEEASGCSELVSICFTDDFLGLEENRLLRQLPVIQNPHNGHELLLSPHDVAFLDDITIKLLEEFDHKLGWRNNMLLAYLRVLLIYVSRLYTEQFNEDNSLVNRDLLKKFKSLVTEKSAECHDVATYAAMLHLSAGHFSELIKEQSGKSAIEHIHDRLLLEAKRMLFHSDSSIKEIAFELGFEDASYFNRFFKRLTSATPLNYRNTIREMYH
jgi:AraC family transcriptional activator of pobA